MSTVWAVYRYHQLHEQPCTWLLFELHFTEEKVEALKGQELRNSLRAPARPARGRPPEGSGISEPAQCGKAHSRSKLCVVWAWASVHKAGCAVLGKQNHTGKPQSPGRARCRPDCRAGCASASGLGCSRPAAGLLVRAHRTERSGPPFLFVGLLSASSLRAFGSSRESHTGSW